MLDALDVERVAVAGWSMGGFVAQRLAARAPERVERLVLLSTDAGGPRAQRAEPAVWARLIDHEACGERDAVIPPANAALLADRWPEARVESVRGRRSRVHGPASRENRKRDRIVPAPMSAWENKRLVRRFYAEAINARDVEAVERLLTHDGDFLGFAPTGRRVEFTSTAVLRIAEGLIAEAWDEVDLLGLTTQLGDRGPASAG